MGEAFGGGNVCSTLNVIKKPSLRCISSSTCTPAKHPAHVRTLSLDDGWLVSRAAEGESTP